MGLWDNTAYVATGELDAVERALVEIFAADGRMPIFDPGDDPMRRDAMKYGNGETSRFWAVALFAGAPGWSVIKTAPFEILCERIPVSTSVILTWCYACNYGYYGDEEKAKEFLERAIAMGASRAELRNDPDFDPVRHRPWFTQLLG